jgi:hypothetical protein
MNDVRTVMNQRKEYYLNRLHEGAQQKRTSELLDAGAKANAPKALTPKRNIGTHAAAEPRNVTLSSQATPTATSITAPKVSTAASSIGSSVVNNTTSIEIPPEIDVLIDNKAYYNKFKKLIREGHLQDLLELAEIALTKDEPSHWFAKSTKTTAAPGQEGLPTMWERSLKYLAKLRDIRRMAELVAAKIGTTVTKGIYKQIWKGANVERWADLARESRQLARQGTRRRDTDPAKLFMWLCSRELAGALAK